MAQVRVAAVPLNQTPLDWDGNLENILAGLAEARQLGASVVCMPELSISGYGCEDAFLWPSTSTTSQQVLQQLLPETKGLVVSVGLPIHFEGAVYNCAALLVDGEIAGLVAKRHLAGEGLHYEPRWFRPWPRGVKRNIAFGNKRVPLGDIVFELGGVRLGFEICEDAWVEERPGFELSRAGVSLVLNPSASHFAFGKHAVRRRIVLSGVREFGVSYVYCNLLGNEAGRAIYDGDAIVAEPSEEHGAHVVAETRRLSYRPFNIACATLNLPQTEAKGGHPARHLVSAAYSFPSNPPTDLVSRRTPGANDQGEVSKEAALARVLSLGLFDYMRKTRAWGFVVSLSGGADSAAVATLVWLMVKLGWEELGSELFLRRAGLQAQGTPGELLSSILLTVYQGTKNSSETTRDAARQVAQALGAEHHELDVEPLAESYRKLTEQVIGRDLNWDKDDLALQNIQARVRAPSVWMLANVHRKLLLSTSNRSEAAVGYATMDGDTAGGLCPIGGVDKAFLRKWLQFMEKEGLPESGPVSALRAINVQPPTAELRPAEQSQTDESDLMPYEVLDVIERLAVVKRNPVSVVLAQVTQTFPQYEAEEIKRWVERFYRLFAHNQWKRERYAPSFHVDDANLDPKTWCRFPILSGGFRRELSELE